MAQELLSAEQVAEMLGLHVRTVRNYVREGKLNAVRIGKQYRIAYADVEAFTGHAAKLPSDHVRRRRHVEVSSIVEIDAVDPEPRPGLQLRSPVRRRDDRRGESKNSCGSMRSIIRSARG